MSTSAQLFVALLSFVAAAAASTVFTYLHLSDPDERVALVDLDDLIDSWDGRRERVVGTPDPELVRIAAEAERAKLPYGGRVPGPELIAEVLEVRPDQDPYQSQYDEDIIVKLHVNEARVVDSSDLYLDVEVRSSVDLPLNGEIYWRPIGQRECLLKEFTEVEEGEFVLTNTWEMPLWIVALPSGQKRFTETHEDGLYTQLFGDLYVEDWNPDAHYEVNVFGVITTFRLVPK